MNAAALTVAASMAAVVALGAVLRRPNRGRELPHRLDHLAAADAGPGERASRDPARRRTIVVAAVAVAAATTLLVGPVVVGAGVAAAFGFRSLRRRRSAADTQRGIDASMPDAIELLVACLHAGRSPAQAVADMARLAPLPVRPAFAAVEQRLHRGQGFGEALAELITRCGTSALALVNAMSAAVRDGLPLAPVLDRLTDEANAGRRRQGEAAARRLPVRLSFPLVLCTLPSFVLLSVAPAILGAVSSLRDSPL